jgi:hypothetical protein
VAGGAAEGDGGRDELGGGLVAGWFVAAGLAVLLVLTLGAWAWREIGWWQWALERRLWKGEDG